MKAAVAIEDCILLLSKEMKRLVDDDNDRDNETRNKDLPRISLMV